MTLEMPSPQLLCPHCNVPVASDAAAARCPSCRLVVGQGRGVLGDGTASAGTSAGVMANAARRADAQPVDRALVIDAVLEVAKAVPSTVQRLRMIDYDAYVKERKQLPTLPEVLATFGSWKAARAAAAPQLKSAEDEKAGP